MTDVDDTTEEDSDQTPAKRSPGRSVVEWIIVVVIAVTVAFLVKTFVVQQYYIDGPSMKTTLEPSDRVLVNKLSYRLHDVHRGDVIVFDRITKNGDVIQHDDLIKRVIGLPGETVEVHDCVVFIDSRRLEEPYLDPALLVLTNPAERCKTPELDPQTVPGGQLFVMGDNRAQSFDSRDFGAIDADKVAGRAFVIVWPFGHWGWL